MTSSSYIADPREIDLAVAVDIAIACALIPVQPADMGVLGREQQGDMTSVEKCADPQPPPD